MTTIREGLRAALTAAGSDEETSDVETTPIETTEEAPAEEADAVGSLHGHASKADAGGDSSGTGVDSGSRAESDAGRTARARAADGKFTKPDKTVAPTTGAKALVKPSPVAPKTETKTKAPEPAKPTVTGAPAAGATETVKPPQSWKPLAREKWAALPAEVQQEVARREKEIASALSESAPAKRFQDEFRQTLAPYAPMLGQADPIKTVGSLLQSAYVLNHAPAQQKAQLLARMVKQFGVDVGALDEALQGVLQGQPAQAQAPSQGAPSAVDPSQIAAQVRQQLMQEMGAQRVAEAAQSFQAESPEFLEDLKPEIAGILKAGLAKDLKSAYNRALSMHRGDPQSEIGAVLRQREAAQQANAQQASTQRAKLAASSVKSQPAGAAAPQQAMDRREQLRAALANKSR